MLAASLISALTCCTFLLHKVRWYLYERKKETLLREESLRQAAGSVAELLRDIMDAASLSGENDRLLRQRIRRMLCVDSQCRPGDLLRLFPAIADLRYHGIMQHLVHDHPRLHPDDLILCSLICLDFPAHSIQTIYRHAHTGSYYNRRSRLRNRLDMTEEDGSLRQFLVARIEELAGEPTLKKPEKEWVLAQKLLTLKVDI